MYIKKFFSEDTGDRYLAVQEEWLFRKLVLVFDTVYCKLVLIFDTMYHAIQKQIEEDPMYKRQILLVKLNIFRVNYTS